MICVHSVGWGKDYRNEGFGGQSGVKVQLVNLISSVQTLLRGSELIRQLVMVVISSGWPLESWSMSFIGSVL